MNAVFHENNSAALKKHYCFSLRINSRFHLFDGIVPSLNSTWSPDRHIGGTMSLITRSDPSSRRTVTL